MRAAEACTRPRILHASQLTRSCSQRHSLRAWGCRTNGGLLGVRSCCTNCNVAASDPLKVTPNEIRCNIPRILLLVLTSLYDTLLCITTTAARTTILNTVVVILLLILYYQTVVLLSIDSYYHIIPTTYCYDATTVLVLY